ncbi:MAG: metal-dependent hydrolase [Desulfovibrio sp.]|jgi:L-ascorbate metabolism protein UlaG (beta-lactamase superfamily)|nr:metal-dependent hydrolase [Desulfovibrio sp.]
MSELTWYGHSAFKITSVLSSGSVSVLIDPFFTPDSGMTADNADKTGPIDMVLVTHDHADHVGDAVAVCKNTGAMLGAIVETVDKLVQAGVSENQVLNGIGFNIGGTITHKGVRTTMTQACHSSESGAPTGYIIGMPDGLTVYHAGDTCVFSGMEIWGSLYSIDIALLPVGGLFTMDAKQAAFACNLLKCKAVVPMHWGTFSILAQSTADFRHELAEICPECHCIDIKPGESFILEP